MRGEMDKFIVCRVVGPWYPGSTVKYQVHTVFSGESYMFSYDEHTGSPVTLIRRHGGFAVNVVGEFCGEYWDIGKAHIHANQLQSVNDVMDS